MITHDAGKNTVDIGCFSIQKDCCLPPQGGTRQAKSSCNIARPFPEKRDHFDFVLFSESGSSLGEVIRA
jgi:hypothetical protein